MTLKPLLINCYLLLGCSFSLLSSVVVASDLKDTSATFVPAVFVTNNNPSVEEVPDERNDQEGWTYMNFVIDESGKVQSPLILDYSENSRFLSDSLAYINGLKYSPATLMGKPVSSHQFLFLQHRINSGRDQNKSAGKRFAEDYGETLQLIGENRLEDAELAINDLKQDFTKNLARKSWIARLSAMLNFRQKDYDNYLRNLFIAGALTEDYLSNKVAAKLYMNLFEMQMYAHRYVDASETLNTMKNSEKVTIDDDSYSALLTRVATQLVGESPFTVKLKLANDKWQHYRVHRSTLEINWQPGTLTGFTVRCPGNVKDYMQNMSKEGQSMTLETLNNNCVLLVKGELGSEVTINVGSHQM